MTEKVSFTAMEDGTQADYDVIFVGDVGLGDEGLTAQQCEMIAGLVRRYRATRRTP